MKSILITGCSSGIGYATAKQLQQLGWRVFASCRQPADVARLQTNLNKDQVRHLLGSPHFDEGVFGPKVWNYVLDVRLPQSAQYQRCELHLEFDKHGFVENMHWKDRVCAQLHKQWMAQPV